MGRARRPPPESARRGTSLGGRRLSPRRPPRVRARPHRPRRPGAAPLRDPAALAAFHSQQLRWPMVGEEAGSVVLKPPQEASFILRSNLWRGKGVGGTRRRLRPPPGTQLVRVAHRARRVSAPKVTSDGRPPSRRALPVREAGTGPLKGRRPIPVGARATCSPQPRTSQRHGPEAWPPPALAQPSGHPARSHCLVTQSLDACPLAIYDDRSDRRSQGAVSRVTPLFRRNAVAHHR